MANFGYIYGFIAGIIFSCLIFVYTYSQIGLAFPPTDLSEFSSTVVRAEQQVKILKNSGKKIAIFRLSGYVFFASASKIDGLFKSINIDLMVITKLSNSLQRADKLITTLVQNPN